MADGSVRVPWISIFSDIGECRNDCTFKFSGPWFKRLKRPLDSKRLSWFSPLHPGYISLLRSSRARSAKEALTLAWPHFQSPSSYDLDLHVTFYGSQWQRAQPRTHIWGDYGRTRLCQTDVMGVPPHFWGTQSSAVWPSAYSAFVESSASRFLSNKLLPLSSVTVSQGHGFGIVWLMQAGCDHIF